MGAMNLSLFYLLSESIAVDGFHLINNAVLTGSLRSNVIPHVIIVKLPTEYCNAVVFL